MASVTRSIGEKWRDEKPKSSPDLWRSDFLVRIDNRQTNKNAVGKENAALENCARHPDAVVVRRGFLVCRASLYFKPINEGGYFVRAASAK
ncbi:MAG: hypothetical protein ABSH48_15540 [Verrucomicrobiota bacterium]|jgi:hypothetical protein